MNYTTLTETASALIAPTGDGPTFSSQHIQRPALLFLSGSPSRVYVGFSMIDGYVPTYPSGWVLGYNATNLSQAPLTYQTTSTGVGGGVWQGGGGLAAGADSSGTTYLYFGTGNGTFDLNMTGGKSVADSFVKRPTNLSNSGADYFTPYTQFCMSCSDQDFGSGGVTLVPDNFLSAPYNYLAVSAGKDGNIYVMDRTSPGRYHGPANPSSCSPTPSCTGSNNNLEVIADAGPCTGPPPPYHNNPAFWSGNGYLYYSFVGGPLTAYPVASSCQRPFPYDLGPPVCARGPCSGTSPGGPSNPSTSIHFAYGTTPSVSSNPQLLTGIVWAIWQDGSAQGGLAAKLYAFSSDLSTELYDTAMCGSTDALDQGTKFSVPTVANGFVYVGTQGHFNILGLITNKTC